MAKYFHFRVSAHLHGKIMKLQGGRIIKKNEDRWKCDMMTHKKT